jgi:hypothetical protein
LPGGIFCGTTAGCRRCIILLPILFVVNIVIRLKIVGVILLNELGLTFDAIRLQCRTA